MIKGNSFSVHLFKRKLKCGAKSFLSKALASYGFICYIYSGNVQGIIMIVNIAYVNPSYRLFVIFSANCQLKLVIIVLTTDKFRNHFFIISVFVYGKKLGNRIHLLPLGKIFTVIEGAFPEKYSLCFNFLHFLHFPFSHIYGIFILEFFIFIIV